MRRGNEKSCNTKISRGPQLRANFMVSFLIFTALGAVIDKDTLPDHSLIEDQT